MKLNPNPLSLDSFTYIESFWIIAKWADWVFQYVVLNIWYLVGLM